MEFYGFKFASQQEQQYDDDKLQWCWIVVTSQYLPLHMIFNWKRENEEDKLKMKKKSVCSTILNKNFHISALPLSSDSFEYLLQLFPNRDPALLVKWCLP